MPAWSPNDPKDLLVFLQFVLVRFSWAFPVEIQTSWQGAVGRTQRSEGSHPQGEHREKTCARRSHEVVARRREGSSGAEGSQVEGQAVAQLRAEGRGATLVGQIRISKCPRSGRSVNIQNRKNQICFGYPRAWS